MFNYTMPCGGFHTHTNMSATGITFDPPVYEQRYCTIIQILEDSRWNHEIKKVTEFGCAEMRLFQLMRRIETIQHILQVDIDDVILKTHLNRTNPLVSDYLRQRRSPLCVEVLHGSVADSSEELRNTDVVIAVELIEHVYDDVLSRIPANVFGFMQPKIAVFTTPNSDYNVLFTRFNPLLSNGFRHYDHKFEWTRAEFSAWCKAITEKYPNYMFALMGVGDPPTGFESVGHVSQIALFVRKDLLGKSLIEPIKHMAALETSTPYKSLHVVNFPYYRDTRTKEQKIWAEIDCELNRCRSKDDYWDNDELVFKYPISELLARVQYLGVTSELLDQQLKQHGKQVKNGYIIIEEELDLSSTDDQSEERESTVLTDNSGYVQENWNV